MNFACDAPEAFDVSVDVISASFEHKGLFALLLCYSGGTVFWSLRPNGFYGGRREDLNL